MTNDLALGDVDGDGDLDIVFGNNGQDRLYLNDGTGTFSDVTATHFPADLDWTSALALGDMDLDGDPDLFLGGQRARLYLNDGTGLFGDETTTYLPVYDPQVFILAVAVGDMDGDGDSDLAYGGVNDRLLTNVTRQIAWRGVPRVGKPLTMDLYGSPGGIWLLAWAMNSAEIPLPPWGTLRLDPGSLQMAGSGVLDGDGFATLSWSTPSDPALVGVSFHLQAAIGMPLRLSNREAATFTDL